MCVCTCLCIFSRNVDFFVDVSIWMSHDLCFKQTEENRRLIGLKCFLHLGGVSVLSSVTMHNKVFGIFLESAVWNVQYSVK